MSKQKIAVLGSTGNVGKKTLKILYNQKKFFSVEFLLCDKNYKEIIKQISTFKPKYVYINNLKVFNKVKKKFNNKIRFLNSKNQLKLIKKNSFDITVCATSGLSCFDINFLFVELSKKMLIANKETLICGNKIFINKCKINKTEIFSIDSEHFCLNELLKNENKKNIKNFYITASGGPFFNIPFKKYKKAKISQTLSHPKWKMGKKISIDSATIVNKIFEVFEASVLFDIPINKIKIKIHPESLLHSAIVFKNGLVKFVGHDTSMNIPIINSLDKNYFHKKNFFDDSKSLKLNFFRPNNRKLKILNLIPIINKYGHSGIVIFNILNDYLVYKYLQKKIYFYEIEKYLLKIFSLDKVRIFCNKKITNYKDIMKTFLFAEKLCLKI